MYSSPSVPRVVSHRGRHSDLPENSLPAFEAAIDAGAWGIELDVHGSLDGELFVHHDATLSIGGRDIPFTELDSRDVGNLRLPGDVAIPTLDQVLTSIGARAKVFIEVKARGIEESVARCLKRHIANVDRYAVHAFDHRVVKRLLELSPSIRTGVLQVSYLLDTAGAMRRAGASDLWQHSDFIDPALVIDVHAAGGQVVAWTPNTPARWDELADMGVDVICTDMVDACVEWAQRRAEAKHELYT
jgi:glycerophosphoryl diester phosphodiesterase